MAGLSAKAPYLFGTSERDCKELVVTVLSAEWPLSAKKVYHKIKNEFGYDITYQGVYKVLQHLLQRGVVSSPEPKAYELNLQWLREVEQFARITRNNYLESKTGLEPVLSKAVKSARVRIYTDPDDIYVVGRQLLLKERTIRIMSKTPIIILKQDAELTPIRQIYANTLLERARKGLLKVDYVFAGDVTLERILRERDTASIEKIREILNINNIRLRYAPVASLFSIVIGSRDCLIGFSSPAHGRSISTLHLSNYDTKDLAAVYDNIFGNSTGAKEFAEKLIIKLKRK